MMMHVSVSIRGLLAQSDDELSLYLGGGLTKDDGKPFRSVRELRSVLVDGLAEGYEYIPAAGCDNFDPKRGCMGHPGKCGSK